MPKEKSGSDREKVGLSSPPEIRPFLETQTNAPATPLRPMTPTFAPESVLAGRYRIARFIAQGGMGEVYEAEDLELGERVALKTVRPDIAQREGSIERLKREIHLARKVTHPNVCRLFDLGVHRFAAEGDRPEFELRFLTMELLQGETLSQRIHRTGQFKSADALPLVRQMAAALGTAHEAGIVHRDFKSSNVILVRASASGGERAVVTDFGLARAMSPADSLEASLTGSGSSLGTPAYMAPEQVEGKEAGPPADIYAFGVVMYEMVTGRWPFSGQSPMSIAVKRLTEAPRPPRQLVAKLDPVWEAAILRCLQRQPADRFQTTREVVEALERTKPPFPRRGALRLAAVIAAGLALLAAGGYLASRLSRPSETPSPVAAVPLRRAVAVLGFKNLGRPESAWLSTAISEMLRTELAAGEKVRTIPGESVARMKMELSLAETDSLAGDSLSRIRANLGADLVVLGSYLSLKGGRVRLDFRLQDTSGGEVLATAAEEATEDEVFALVSKAGAKIRQALAIGTISEADASAVRASLPSRPEAARLYSEGLARLRVFDALGGRERLEKAVEVEGSHPLPHAALAAAWSALGYDGKARDEARRAFELSSSLSREDRLMVEASYRQISGEWERAVEIYRSLLVFFPDRLDYGLSLAAAEVAAGKGKEALATVEGLRKLPSPSAEDPRIDLEEANAAKALTDFQRQEKAAREAAGKARAQRQLLLLAQARLSEGDALVNQGRLEDAQKAGEEARGVFAAAGDARGAARAENIVAVTRVQAGDLRGARKGFESALGSFRQVGDQRGIARQLGNVAGALDELGDRAGARKLYGEALKVSREIGDKSGIARTLNGLGMLQLATGDLVGARRTYEEALQVFQELGERRNVAVALNNIGEILQKQGQAEAAGAKFEESLKISRPIGDKGLIGETLTHVARVSEERRDLATAQARLEEALALFREAGEKEREVEVLRALAAVVERRGDRSRSAALREEAAAIERSENK